MESKKILRPKIWIGIGVIVYIIALTIAVFQAVTHMSTGETEFHIIRSMIENIDAYQDEIESWGYQVSVFPLEEEPEDEMLRYYYREYCRPILLLTDANGGQYYFYYGFDRYASVVSYTAMVRRTSGEYEEALKTVTLELFKRELYQAPFEENLNEVGTYSYYDIVVHLYVTAFSEDEGKEIWASNESGFCWTYYCSNNFVDHMHFNGFEPEADSRSADHAIKREYSAEQLLEYYQQGIALQKRLVTLYRQTSGE